MVEMDVNKVAKDLLETMKNQRFEAAKKHDITSHLVKFGTDLGFNEETNRDVFAGNTKDARIFSGFILANCSLNDDAKAKFTKEAEERNEELNSDE